MTFNCIVDDSNDDMIVVDKSKIIPVEIPQLENYCKANGIKVLDTELNQLIFNQSPQGNRQLVKAKKSRISKVLVKKAINNMQFPTIRKLADLFETSYDYMYMKVKKYDLRDYMKKQIESTIDKVEDTVVNSAIDGDTKAAKLFLEAQAKARGYGSGDNQIQGLNVKVVFQSPGDKNE